MTLIKDEFKDFVSFIDNSATHEMSFHIIHCVVGPLLLVTLCRPPARGDISCIMLCY